MELYYQGLVDIMKTIRNLIKVLVQEECVQNKGVKTLGSVREQVRSILEGVLLEARFPTRKEVLAKRKDDPETIELVNLVQKSLDDAFRSKSSKYFPIVFDYIDKNSDKNVQELLDDAIVTLLEFDKIPGVDLNKFTTFEELDSFTQDAFLQKHKKSEKASEISNDTINAGDSTLLFDNNDVILYRINSKEGANALAGKDTTWCIARKSGSYFNQYTSTNQIFYFVIDKNLPVDDKLQKVAIRVTKDLDSDRVNDINYTSKRNDGDDSNPNELPYYRKIKSIIERDAKAQPPTLLVKVKSGKATQTEAEELWNNYKSSPMSEKQQLNNIVGGAYDDKINEIKNKKFNSIPSDWKNLDAAFIEKLIKKFHDDNFYKKVLELHNPFLDKKIVNNTQNKLILKQILLRLPENDDLRIAYDIATRTADTQIMQMIINRPNCRDEKYALIDNPKFPIDTLVDDQDTDIRVSVASARPLSPESLQKLSSDPKSEVRSSLAKSEHVPVGILDKLSSDPDNTVRAGVAFNQNATPAILEKLSSDYSNNTLIGVAQNQNTPVEIINKLCFDKEVNVRWHALRNANVSTEVLRKLSTSKDNETRKAIVGNENTPIEVINNIAASDTNVDVRAIALGKTTSVKLLSKLSASNNKEIRIAVASNLNTPPDVLADLSSDEDTDVVSAVAQNSNVPENILVELSESEEDYVRMGVAGNPNTPHEVLWNFIKSNEQLPSVVLNKNTTHDMLAAIVDSNTEEAEYAQFEIARNKNAPVELLKKLSEFDNEEISNDAKKTLNSLNK
jgi:hypothetical protein